MKKELLVALSVVMMVSCSKNELMDVPHIAGDPEIININPFTGKQTKAADKTLFANGDTFAVYANQGTAPSGFFINGITTPADKYVKTGETWGWASVADNHKWSAVTSYPARFYATYPEQTLLPSGASNDNFIAPKFTYSVTPAVQSNNMVDLLAASSVRSVTNTGILLFPFEHILSKIDFSVKVDSKVKVYIQSVKIWNAGKTATYTFNPGANGAWSNPVAPINESFGYMGVVNPATTHYVGTMKIGSSVNHALIMMPQTSTGWVNPGASSWLSQGLNSLKTGTYIELVYRMTDFSGNDIIGFTDAVNYVNKVHSVTGNLWVKVGYSFAANWAQKTQYTYTIGLGGQTNTGGILIDGNYMKNDGSDSGLPVILPDTKEPLLPGNPIVNTDKVIDLSVSINPWTPASNSDIQ